MRREFDEAFDRVLEKMVAREEATQNIADVDHDGDESDQDSVDDSEKDSVDDIHFSDSEEERIADDK